MQKNPKCDNFYNKKAHFWSFWSFLLAGFLNEKPFQICVQ